MWLKNLLRWEQPRKPLSSLDIVIELFPERNSMSESSSTHDTNTGNLGIAPSGQLESRDGKVQATKYDDGKPRMSLVPKRALIEVAKVFTFGANTDPNKGPVKYGVGNWHSGDSFDWSRLLDASDRHGEAFQLGEDNDVESGLSHLAHRICCDMMLLELVLTGHGKDDRSKIQYLPPYVTEKSNA
jgi:hypothetical protein